MVYIHFLLRIINKSTENFISVSHCPSHIVQTERLRIKKNLNIVMNRGSAIILNYF